MAKAPTITHETKAQIDLPKLAMQQAAAELQPKAQVRSETRQSNRNRVVARQHKKQPRLQKRANRKWRFGQWFKRHRTHTGAARHPDLLAILALVFGIVGFLWGMGVAAIVCGHIALRRGQRRGFALAGLILGYIKLLVAIAYIAILLAIFVIWW